MTETIKLGHCIFTSKKAATDAVQDLLWKHELGNQQAMRVSDEDEAILRDLIELSPEKAEKVGPGIRYFEVRRNGIGLKGQGFVIVRVDGSAVDFSYRRMITGKVITPRENFIRACRHAVQPFINEEKERFFAEAERPTCCITGDKLKKEECEVDHAPPYTFALIVEGFVAMNRIDMDDPDLVYKPKDGASVVHVLPMLADPMMRDRFIQFHNTYARLRVISIRANQGAVQKAFGKGKTR